MLPYQKELQNLQKINTDHFTPSELANFNKGKSIAEKLIREGKTGFLIDKNGSVSMVEEGK
jgi:hypothetical protein